MSFDTSLQTLLAPIDRTHHAAAAQRLEGCRSRADLDEIVAAGGWLGPEQRGQRLKLVRHASGTFLVVAYEDGWSSRVSQAGF